MGKKKRPSVEAREESSDSSSEQKIQGTEPMRNGCQHIKKSVDTLKLRKLFRNNGLSTDCSQCLKNDNANVTASADNVENHHPTNGEDEFTETGAFEYDNTLWLCLKCGTQLCGRSRNQHALRHFKTPHSDFHALTMNTRSYEIWCYECDNEISANSHSNLAECVGLVRKISQKSTSIEHQHLTQPDVLASSNISNNPTENFIAGYESLRLFNGAINNNSSNSFTLNPNAKIFNPSFINNNVDDNTTLPPPPPPPLPGIAKRVIRPAPNLITSKSIFSNLTASSTPFTPGFMTNVCGNLQTSTADRDLINGLPRVRGLTNLGNTCFFNAVMQCLAQTPYLLDVLKELSQPGEEFTLPGGTFKFKDQEDLVLPKITGTLTLWGSLTSALAHVLEELQMGGGVFTPSKLFEKLCSKCPQFCGGDQHDAHELLRHLLESVRSEDLKRYQRVILHNLGYKESKVNCPDLRQKCKIYGDQASDRILRPDQVFRGFLVSTLTCLDCFNVSSRHEYFLDLSLPVNIEKPQPPQRRKTSPDNGPSHTFYVNPAQNLNSNNTASVQTKAQAKKEAEKERKEKRAAKHRNAKAAQKLALEKEYNAISNANLTVDANTNVVISGNLNNNGNDNNAEVISVGGSANTDNVNTPSTASSTENKSTANSSESEQSDADIEDNLVDDSNPNTKIWRPIPQASTLTAVGLSTMDFNGNNEPSSPIQAEKRGDSPERIDKDSLDEDENDSGIATSPVNASISNFATSSCSSSGGVSNGDSVPMKESDIINVGITGKAVGLIQLSDDDDLAPKRQSNEDDTNMNDANLDTTITKENVNGANIDQENTLNDSKTIENDVKTNENDDAVMNDTNKVAQQIDQLQLHEQIESRKSAKRMRTQSYSDWSTTIAPRYQCKDGECSVQMCLNNFTAVERMTANNKVGCENCTRRMNGDDPKAKTVNTNATKQFLISSPPAVLILHLKRFQLGPRCIFRKLSQAVVFPMVLDIAPFCGSKVKNLPNINRKQKKLLYALYGIVEHSGSMYGGHYKAFVKVRAKLERDDKRWKFLPQGSRAELDQDDEQRKKLEELLAKEKARDLCGKVSDDSDDFSSLNSTSLSDVDEAAKATAGNGENMTEGDKCGEQGAVGGDPDAEGVEVPMGKWYYVSDSRVTEVTEEEVLKAQAYLLFYERIY